jgi:hypothetical protein
MAMGMIKQVKQVAGMIIHPFGLLDERPSFATFLTEHVPLVSMTFGTEMFCKRSVLVQILFEDSRCDVLIKGLQSSNPFFQRTHLLSKVFSSRQNARSESGTIAHALFENARFGPFQSLPRGENFFFDTGF